MSTTTLSARGRVAALSRSRTAEDPEYLEARRVLAASKIENYVAAVIATAPLLTEHEVRRITAALRGSVSDR